MKTIKYSRFFFFFFWYTAGSWTKWKSEATNPFLALRVYDYVKMSEIHETGGVQHKI
jgi:hypothetical protein